MRSIHSPRPSLVRSLAAVFGLLVIVAASRFVVLPVAILSPGPAPDALRLVTVKGAETYRSSGKLRMTTVELSDESTPMQLAAALFDRTQAILPRSAVVPRGQTERQVVHYNEALMDQSQQTAMVVALRYLGREAEFSGDGARVERTLRGMPASGVLFPGDVINAIDGRPVRTADDAVRVVSSKPYGELKFEFRRKGVLRGATIATKRGKIGSELTTSNPRVESDVDVAFNTKNIGGPSAGLAFSLAIIDRLNSQDLTKGNIIAATGSVTPQGGVEQVGGVAQKVAGAEAQGARVFLVPKAEMRQAQKVSTRARIIGVSSVKEAVMALERLPSSSDRGARANAGSG